MITTPQLWHALTDDERYQRLTDAEMQRDDVQRLYRPVFLELTAEQIGRLFPRAETAPRLLPGHSGAERKAVCAQAA